MIKMRKRLWFSQYKVTWQDMSLKLQHWCHKCHKPKRNCTLILGFNAEMLTYPIGIEFLGLLDWVITMQQGKAPRDLWIYFFVSISIYTYTVYIDRSYIYIYIIECHNGASMICLIWHELLKKSKKLPNKAKSLALWLIGLTQSAFN